MDRHHQNRCQHRSQAPRVRCRQKTSQKKIDTPASLTPVAMATKRMTKRRETTRRKERKKERRRSQPCQQHAQVLPHAAVLLECMFLNLYSSTLPSPTHSERNPIKFRPQSEQKKKTLAQVRVLVIPSHSESFQAESEHIPSQKKRQSLVTFLPYS